MEERSWGTKSMIDRQADRQMGRRTWAAFSLLQAFALPGRLVTCVSWIMRGEWERRVGEESERRL